MSSPINRGANRNSVSTATIAMYVLGLLAFVSGLRVSTVTRINLLTGQTSLPYLGIGIPLVIGGVVLIAVTQMIAKQKLSR